MCRFIPTIAALAFLGACGGQPPAEDLAQQAAQQAAARADSVQMALAQFDSTVCDTVTWATTQEALERGSLVFRISCAKCHGDGGRGNGNFVHQGDTLRPPSFLTVDWKYAEDRHGLQRAIYTGSALDMPYWGLVGLKYRDLDAVSRYVLDFLRLNYTEPTAQ